MLLRASAFRPKCLLFRILKDFSAAAVSISCGLAKIQGGADAFPESISIDSGNASASYLIKKGGGANSRISKHTCIFVMIFMSKLTSK